MFLERDLSYQVDGLAGHTIKRNPDGPLYFETCETADLTSRETSHSMLEMAASSRG